MKAGDSIDCPYCGANSFVRKDSVMDGWTKIGEVLKCVSCSAVIEELKELPVAAFKKTESGSRNALADLLGEKVPENTDLEFMKEDARFCKDCMHMVSHAFILRCSLTDKDINPMDDCPQYVRRSNGKGVIT